MTGFGEQLRQAREARGVSLKAIADATRIALRHLEALERSDLEGLPRGPFGKGYIRAYAEFVGTDPQPILEAYHSQERQRGLGPSATQRRTLEELSQMVRKRAEAERRISPALAWGALAVVALGLLGTGGWLLIGRDAPETDAAPPVAHSVEPPAPAAAAPDAPAAPEPTPQESPVAERTPEAPPPAPPARRTELRVSHSGVGTGVQSRRLVGRADRFVEGMEVSFWTRVLGGVPGAQIRHYWIHEGRVVTRADLAIGGSHWRTHSRLALPRGATGSWAVEARDTDGRVLAREEFLCVPEEP